MKKFIEENLDEMLDDLRQLVSFNSEYSEDEKPFGSGNRKVLNKAIELMAKKGLLTNNLDYYCGYGETGEGDKLIGILAHLDVVPAGDGWNSNPFELLIKDGFCYGRGVSDDKGAAVASMWALKYLIDTGYKFKKKVRLILGCNEENGSLGIKHYVDTLGHVDMGFTPDGDFPGIYAEKGRVGGDLVGHNTNIIDIKSEGASNIVSKECMIKLKHQDIDLKILDSFYKDNNLKYTYENDTLTVYGKAAHASIPEDGVNAINYALVGLYKAGYKDNFIDFFNKKIGLELHGESMGFEALKDDISNTSLNLGVAHMDGNNVVISIDLRFPIKSNVKVATELLESHEDEFNKFDYRHPVESIYYDKNSPFIQALHQAYIKVTGDTVSQMEAIGGGTYAKSMNNIIAFGCEFQGEKNNIHGANESLNIENFKKQIEIYVEAIKNLNEVE